MTTDEAYKAMIDRVESLNKGSYDELNKGGTMEWRQFLFELFKSTSEIILNAKKAEDERALVKHE